MRFVSVVGLLVLVSACGANDVTTTDEYLALLDEHDSFAADIETLESAADDAQAEIADLEARNQELDQQAAVTEEQLAQAQLVKSDFIDFLELRFARDNNLNAGQSECLSSAIVDDAETRQAFVLISSGPDPTSAQAVAADLLLTELIEDCDLDVPDSAEEQSPPDELEIAQAIQDVSRPVEVIGDPLPPLLTTDFSSDPAVGTPAPILIGEGYDGEPVRIDAAGDGPTMVVFLAHWCTHCNAEIPRLNDLRDQGLIPEGVNIVAVSSAVNPGRANFPPDAWLEQVEWTFPTIADDIDVERGTFIGVEAFGVGGFPSVALIDADGNVAARWAGEREADDVARMLAALAAGDQIV